MKIPCATGLIAVCLIAHASAAPPVAPDDRFTVTLFAEHPAIVTPTGCTLDARGRLLVIENHTHFPPTDYAGPKADRIRAFEDTDGDGKADRITTFFEGERDGMDLATAPDGSIYMATRRKIMRLRDTNNDGKADQVVTLITLETDGNYPHNGLSGLAFDGAGLLHFGFGENLGASYKLIGADGMAFQGGGEGGTTYACDHDGNQLRRTATGFWNPFGMAVTRAGNVFAVDNDPDSRPPCRLMHITPGADFGYQFRYGRPGLNPFQAWDGELPNALPMVAGTGEAPCAVVEYDGGLVVASWGDHRLERYELKPHGASYRGERSVLIQGGDDFRPVDIALHADGSFYLTDWVDRSYKLHSKGRIWKITPRDADAARRPASDTPPTALMELAASEDVPTLREALHDTDPVVRAAAVSRLTQNADLRHAVEMGAERDTTVSLGVARAMSLAADEADRARLPELLRNPSEDVRLIAVKWIADEKLIAYRTALEAMLTERTLTTRLALACLAGLAHLDGAAFDGKSNDRFLLPLILDDQRPTSLRVIALRAMPANAPKLNVETLADLLENGEPALRQEAVRRLADHKAGQRFGRLADAAHREDHPLNVRAEAIIALGPDAQRHTALLIRYATEKNITLRDAALRTLVGVELDESQRLILTKAMGNKPESAELYQRVLGLPRPERPAFEDTDAWLKRLEGPTDVEAGRRVFFNSRLVICASCHRVDQRGNPVGPDLTHFAQTKTDTQLLEAILQPSKEIAPQFYTWVITTRDGQTRSGFLHAKSVSAEGVEEYIDAGGKSFTVKILDITARQALPASIMPPGLLHALTDQELRNLIAFLKSAR